MLVRWLILSAIACALSIAACACQFDSSPLRSTIACGAASGTACDSTGATPASAPGMRLDAAMPPVPAAVGMQPRAAATPPPPAPFDAGAAPPPATKDAGTKKPPPHDPRADTDADPAPALDASASDSASGDAAMVADAAEPGSAFTPCSANTDCATGSYCTVDPNAGSPAGSHGYCTTACGASGWPGAGNPGGWTGAAGSPADPGNAGITCVQPSSGAVTASCQFPGLCLLDACDAKTCPDGLACVQTPVPSQSGQVVWVSACQVKPAP
jgi:hypothetical protein